MVSAKKVAKARELLGLEVDETIPSFSDIGYTQEELDKMDLDGLKEVLEILGADEDKIKNMSESELRELLHTYQDDDDDDDDDELLDADDLDEEKVDEKTVDEDFKLPCDPLVDGSCFSNEFDINFYNPDADDEPRTITEEEQDLENVKGQLAFLVEREKQEMEQQTNTWQNLIRAIQGGDKSRKPTQFPEDLVLHRPVKLIKEGVYRFLNKETDCKRPSVDDLSSFDPSVQRTDLNWNWYRVLLGSFSVDDKITFTVRKDYSDYMEAILEKTEPTQDILAAEQNIIVEKMKRENETKGILDRFFQTQTLAKDEFFFMLKCTPADLDAVFDLKNNENVELKVRLLLSILSGLDYSWILIGSSTDDAEAEAYIDRATNFLQKENERISQLVTTNNVSKETLHGSVVNTIFNYYYVHKLRVVAVGIGILAMKSDVRSKLYSLLTECVQQVNFLLVLYTRLELDDDYSDSYNNIYNKYMLYCVRNTLELANTKSLTETFLGTSTSNAVVNTSADSQEFKFDPNFYFPECMFFKSTT